MTRGFLHHLQETLASVLGHPVPGLQAHPVGGGCIHEAFVLSTLSASSLRFFVKTNKADHLPLFASESRSLHLIHATHTIRAPQPITHGVWQDRSFLVLQHIEFARVPSSASSAALMGAQLAALHRHTSPTGTFGWMEDNHIGATPQPNGEHTDWLVFWREQRLGWQLQLAHAKGLRFSGSERLLDHLSQFFGSYRPVPSLLHGDLWGGNAGFDHAGLPVLFDPASYYGDRETDLAFTELFGGFPAAFHRAYEESWPRDPGWPIRRDLYNLYHVLNHHHLFGGHYAAQAQAMIHQLNRLI